MIYFNIHNNQIITLKTNGEKSKPWLIYNYVLSYNLMIGYAPKLLLIVWDHTAYNTSTKNSLKLFWISRKSRQMYKIKMHNICDMALIIKLIKTGNLVPEWTSWTLLLKTDHSKWYIMQSWVSFWKYNTFNNFNFMHI